MTLLRLPSYSCAIRRPQVEFQSMLFSWPIFKGLEGLGRVWVQCDGVQFLVSFNAEVKHKLNEKLFRVFRHSPWPVQSLSDHGFGDCSIFGDRSIAVVVVGVEVWEDFWRFSYYCNLLNLGAFELSFLVCVCISLSKSESVGRFLWFLNLHCGFAESCPTSSWTIFERSVRGRRGGGSIGRIRLQVTVNLEWD